MVHEVESVLDLYKALSDPENDQLLARKDREIRRLKNKIHEATLKHKKEISEIIEDFRELVDPTFTMTRNKLRDISDDLSRGRKGNTDSSTRRKDMIDISMISDPELSGFSDYRAGDRALLNQKRREIGLKSIVNFDGMGKFENQNETQNGYRGRKDMMASTRRNDMSSSRMNWSRSNTPKSISRRRGNQVRDASPRRHTPQKRSPGREMNYRNEFSESSGQKITNSRNYTPPAYQNSQPYITPSKPQDNTNMNSFEFSSHSSAYKNPKTFRSEAEYLKNPMNVKVEIPDAIIKDKYRYFSHFRKKELAVRDLDGNRLGINSLGSKLYLCSLKGSTILRRTSRGLEVEEDLNSALKSAMVCSFPEDNNMILQEPNSNDLKLCNRDLSEIKRLKGNYKKGTEYGEFDKFNHSLDDNYMLWRRGKSHLGVVDRKKFKMVNTIPDFWIHDTGKSRPFAGISNQDASRIMGASLDKKGDYIIHYYESDGISDFLTSKRVIEFFPKLLEVKALEVSSDGRTAFLAGVSSVTKKSVILAAEFNKSLDTISTIVLDEINYGKPRRIKRIKGYNLLLVACKKHIAVLDFKNYKFKLITNIENVNNTDIVDFVFRNGVLYSKGYKENLLTIVNFDDEGSSQGIPTRSTPIRSGIIPTDSVPGDQMSLTDVDIGSQAYNSSFNKTSVDKIFTDVLNMEKVAVSYDKRRIYVGGKGLTILQISSRGKYEVLQTPALDDVQLFSMRTTNSRHVVIQENGSNDLIVLDKVGNEASRLKGKQPLVFDTTYLRNTEFSETEDYMIWFSGTSSICIVNMSDLSFTEIKGFLPHIDEMNFAIAVRCAAKNKGRTMLVAFLMQGEYNLAYFNQDKEPDIHALADILPKFDKLSSMDVSLYKDVVFIGGSTNSSGARGSSSQAVLAAVQFNSGLSLLAEKVFVMEGIKECSAMRRFRKSDCLAVGGYRDIYVVKFEEKKFRTLYNFKMIHSGLIHDLCILGKRIYSVSRKDKFINTVDFEYEL